MTDIDAYFARIGYDGPTTPTLETLTALVTAHGTHIPFENLDPLMGIPVFDLSARALFDKMVYRRRGGYCYEQNGLLRNVLCDLGFDVDALAGRVVWMNPDGLGGAPTALTHQVLSVRVPGVEQPYLVDVVRRADADLADPVRRGGDPADPARALPAAYPCRRVRARGVDPGQLAAALHLHR